MYGKFLEFCVFYFQPKQPKLSFAKPSPEDSEMSIAHPRTFSCMVRGAVQHRPVAVLMGAVLFGFVAGAVLMWVVRRKSERRQINSSGVFVPLNSQP